MHTSHFAQIVHRAPGCACGGGCPHCNAIQTKLKIGAPNDRYEQEADRVADQVMRMPGRSANLQTESTSRTPPPNPSVDHFTQGPIIQNALPEQEEETEIIQTKRAHGLTNVSAGLGSPLGISSGSGYSLPKQARKFFEPRFGHDFSRVRIHRGARAAGLARKLNARAFTLGREIVFGEGQYAPNTVAGRRLLAHELTHVVQQNRNRIATRRTIFRKPKILFWDYRNSKKCAKDNCSSLCTHDLFTVGGAFPLGVDRVRYNFSNGIEIKAYIMNHEPGYTYDIKRTKHIRKWKKISAKWKKYYEKGPGADDDFFSGNTDECLKPIKLTKNVTYIYSLDGPGFAKRSNPPRDNRATEAIYFGNFIEFVRIQKGKSFSDDPYKFKWHTVLWVKKSGTHWSVDKSKSRINKGHHATMKP